MIWCLRKISAGCMSHGSHSFLRLITGNLNSIRFLGQFHRLANPSIHLLILFFIHVCTIKKVLSLLCAKEERTASLIYSDEGRRDERKSKKVVSILSLNITLADSVPSCSPTRKIWSFFTGCRFITFIPSLVRVYVKKRSSRRSSSDTKRERSDAQKE